ncbi:hypothetical protein NL676_000027 [Syzygium grande]|nr:hypothetical protein NL676_000027 [Syzygium grande]
MSDAKWTMARLGLNAAVVAGGLAGWAFSGSELASEVVWGRRSPVGRWRDFMLSEAAAKLRISNRGRHRGRNRKREVVKPDWECVSGNGLVRDEQSSIARSQPRSAAVIRASRRQRSRAWSGRSRVADGRLDGRWSGRAIGRSGETG